MNDLVLRNTLMRVQDVIAKETGAPLQGDAVKRLENALKNVTSPCGNALRGENFSSCEVTVLVADLRGFTSVSAAYPADMVLGVLNQFLVRMSEIVFRHQGTIDKFMGDSIMVLFGAPVAGEDDARRALLCAVEMQIAMDDINKDKKHPEMPELYMGIGINTGTVMQGLLGSDLHSEYTVIGREVNLAFRIAAFSLRGQVLISRSNFDRCRDFAETSEPMDVYVKGEASPVCIREVLGVPSLRKEVPRQEMRRSTRVRVKVPFTYQVIRNNIIMPGVHQGTILDLGYYGVRAEIGRELGPYSEIKLTLDLSLVGYKATDISAKVLTTRKSKGRYLSGIEFTSVSIQDNLNIRHFVQLLSQGDENQ
ncbi:MAG: adenylate/guanylate cyclase domain-containing protein [Burkholderiales bacterium]